MRSVILITGKGRELREGVLPACDHVLLGIFEIFESRFNRHTSRELCNKLAVENFCHDRQNVQIRADWMTRGEVQNLYNSNSLFPFEILGCFEYASLDLASGVRPPRFCGVKSQD
jgi:hypothetical protein